MKIFFCLSEFLIGGKIPQPNFRMLNLRDNKFKAFQAIEFFAALPPTIEKLDLSGKQNAENNLKNFSKSVAQFHFIFNVIFSPPTWLITSANKISVEFFSD